MVPAASNTLVPVQPEERIAILDVLRGFALFGILAVNLPWSATSDYTWAAGLKPFPDWWDKTAEWIVNTVFAGKFNAIFSFLFGIGFTIQLTRAADRGGNVTATYVRRMAILFAMGLVHELLIRSGDILHMYAILGLVLLAIRRVSDRTVLILALVAFLIPTARSAYSAITHEPWSIPRESMPARHAEAMRVYQSGTYAEQVALRYHEIVESYGFIRELRGEVLGYFIVLVTILFGFYVGRKRIIQELPRHTAWIKRVMLWCGLVGVAAAAGRATIMAVIEPTGRASLLSFLAGFLYALQRPPLCLFYVAGIALLFLGSARCRRLFSPLATVGRMPLTNYLMQSVITAILFYSWGFGLYGRMGPAACLALTIVIFAVQVVYSRWWMARFRFGPLEWVWRGATYGRFPPLANEPPTRGAAVA
jgi:uncharacterized protein